MAVPWWLWGFHQNRSAAISSWLSMMESPIVWLINNSANPFYVPQLLCIYISMIWRISLIKEIPSEFLSWIYDTTSALRMIIIPSTKVIKQLSQWCWNKGKRLLFFKCSNLLRFNSILDSFAVIFISRLILLSRI